MPWKVLVTEEERQRFEAESWIRERFASMGVAITKVSEGLYQLPALERNRRLECAFLDEDGLCSQVKRHGREFWSRTCKTFPYDFIEISPGEVEVSLSQHCPAIRDNFGEPVKAQIERYFADSGSKASTLAPTMHLGLAQLTRDQYLALAALWRERIAATTSLPQALLEIYDFTQELALALIHSEHPTQAEFVGALEKVKASFTPQPLPQQAPTFLARLLLSISLCRMSYPLWANNHSKAQNKFRAGFMAYRNTLRLLNGRGEIDLLLLPRAFDLAEASQVSPVLTDPELAARTKRFFDEVLRRGNLFLRPRGMNQALLDLALSLAIILRIAKYRATASGRKIPDASDLGEGLSYAECLVLFHVSRQPPPQIVELILVLLSDNRRGLVGLLTAEQ